MGRYRLIYDFDAQDDVEISCRKGDIVSSDKSPEDGWLHVTTTMGQRGYVPVGYLKDTSSPVRGSSPPMTSSAAYGNGRGREAASTYGRSVSPGQYETNTSTTTPFIETFMKNELFYKDLLRQRQESMERIERVLGEAAADVASCKDKNAQLTRKLKDLDHLVDKERKKWKDRVDEERVILAQKTSSTSAMPLFVNASPVLHSSHTTTTTTVAGGSSVRSTRRVL